MPLSTPSTTTSSCIPLLPSVGLRIGNRILEELKSAETQCLENRIHLDWYSTVALQGRGRSPDGRWAINHADGEGMGSSCLHRQGADNGGSREQYCTWLHVSTPPTSLTLDSRRAIATAFVASHIDYCNGVLYGVAKGEVQRLQMVLNAAARLVVGTGKFSHVTPILRDVFHWLPVRHRISYKIAILARDCIHGIGPAYFGDVCAPVTAAPGRTNLRSATRGDLVIPRTRTKLGERSFRISAPTVWNLLPDSLKYLATSRKHFRKELKTYLFRKAYAPASENY